MITPKQFIRCIRDGAIATIKHDGVEHAGYLTFLGLLGMFPFLVLVAAVVGVIGQGDAGAHFITGLLATLPDPVTQAVKPRVLEIISGPPQGLLTISILGSIWTASSAVEGLRTVLNRAYQVTTPPAYWFRRSLSILQLLLFAFLLISGMFLVVLIPLLAHHVEDWLNIHPSVSPSHWDSIFFIIPVIVLFFAVACLYYLITNMRQRLVSVVPGAVLVVALWVAAAYVFTQYLSHFNQVNLIYGSLGGIIAALIFFYICNVIFIFGAEFNHQIVLALGLRTIEKEHA